MRSWFAQLHDEARTAGIVVGMAVYDTRTHTSSNRLIRSGSEIRNLDALYLYFGD
jgi:hypothetical protein